MKRSAIVVVFLAFGLGACAHQKGRLATLPEETEGPAVMAEELEAEASIEESEWEELDASRSGIPEGIVEALPDAPEEEREEVPPLGFTDSLASPLEGEIRSDIPLTFNRHVRRWIDLFQRGNYRKWMRRALGRSTRYIPMMREILAHYGLPEDLVYLSMIESGYVPYAYSRAKAVGLWQFIKGTGRRYDLEVNGWHDERRDPVKATHAAARHLKDLYEEFGDWYLALAAYNAGAGKIRRAIERYGTRDYWRLISRCCYLRRETKEYVPKFLAAMIIAKDPARYGFTDVEYQPPLDFETVEVKSPVDLAQVARLCRTDLEALKELNPALRRWFTPPHRPRYALHLPAGSKAHCKAALDRLPRQIFREHHVKPGETLYRIARRYKVAAWQIAALNRISKRTRLKIGQSLRIPVRPSQRPLPPPQLPTEPGRYGPVYVVRKGDTLLRISRKTGVSLAALLELNDLDPNATIYPGERLRLVGKEAAPYYEVRRGDTLARIAARFGTSVAALEAWNAIENPNEIRVGQRLRVVPPHGKDQRMAKKVRKVTHIVQKGDTLWALAERYAVPISALKAWNGIRHHNLIKAGQRIVIYLPHGNFQP